MFIHTDTDRELRGRCLLWLMMVIRELGKTSAHADSCHFHNADNSLVILWIKGDSRGLKYLLKLKDSHCYGSSFPSGLHLQIFSDQIDMTV